MRYTLDDLFNNLESDGIILACPKERIIEKAHQFMEEGFLFEIVLTREGGDGLRLIPIDEERMMVGIYNGFQDALGGRFTSGIKRKERKRLKRIAEKYQFQIISI